MKFNRDCNSHIRLINHKGQQNGFHLYQLEKSICVDKERILTCAARTIPSLSMDLRFHGAGEKWVVAAEIVFVAQLKMQKMTHMCCFWFPHSDVPCGVYLPREWSHTGFLTLEMFAAPDSCGEVLQQQMFLISRRKQISLHKGKYLLMRTGNNFLRFVKRKIFCTVAQTLFSLHPLVATVNNNQNYTVHGVWMAREHKAESPCGTLSGE